MSRAARMRPAGHQDLLLRSALMPEPAAAEARARWAAQVDLDRLDLGSLQLLPMLSLKGLGETSDGELEKQIRHVIRFSWLRTELLARGVAPVVAALDEAGLKPMLSKGAALVYAHGISSRYRPMFDIDISIDSTALQPARQVLREYGFRAELERVLDRHAPRLIEDVHAVAYSAPGGAAIDLHWHMFHSVRNNDLDRQIRDAAVPCTIGGVECWATSLEDTIVVAVAHGTRWARGAAVRWVGDVALLLREHSEDIDWDAVVSRSRQTRLSRSMADALEYVEELTEIGPPRSTMRELRMAPQPVAVRLRRMRPDDPADGGPRAPGRLGRMADAYEEDVSCHAAPGARTGPLDVSRFLARRWGLRSARRVPVHGAWVAVGRPWSVRRLLHRGLGPDALAWLEGRPHYELGTVLRFDDLGEGHTRLGPGWWYPEPFGTWTRSTCARVVLPLAQMPPGKLQLDAYLYAPITARNPEVTVALVVGDQPLGEVKLTAENETTLVRFEFEPTALTREAVAVISLVVKPVLAPADARLNSDLRQLGTALLSLRLDVAPAPPLHPPTQRTVNVTDCESEPLADDAVSR